MYSDPMGADFYHCLFICMFSNMKAAVRSAPQHRLFIKYVFVITYAALQYIINFSVMSVLLFYLLKSHTHTHTERLALSLLMDTLFLEDKQLYFTVGELVK